jgi:hypothetical protein
MSDRPDNNKYNDLWSSFLDTEIDKETIYIVNSLIYNYRAELKLKSKNYLKSEQLKKFTIKSSSYSLTLRLRIRDKTFTSKRGEVKEHKIGTLHYLLNIMFHRVVSNVQKFDLVRLAQLGVYLDLMKIKRKFRHKVNVKSKV